MHRSIKVCLCISTLFFSLGWKSLGRIKINTLPCIFSLHPKSQIQGSYSPLKLPSWKKTTFMPPFISHFSSSTSPLSPLETITLFTFFKNNLPNFSMLAFSESSFKKMEIIDETKCRVFFFGSNVHMYLNESSVTWSSKVYFIFV